MTAGTVELAGDATILTLTAADGRTGTFHAMWLRDACRCEVCRRPSTGERLLDSTTIPFDLSVTTARLDSDAVELAFSDGHSSRLPVDGLLDHAADDDHGDRPAGHHRLLAWLDALWADGLAVVRGVAPDVAGLLGVADHIGPVLPSNYGPSWEIEATVDPETAVDSQLPLRVHTDLPYRTNPPGLQLMLVAVTTVAGGASTFTDGYAVAEALRRDHPGSWELLTTVPFTYVFDRPGVHLEGRSPLIERRADGRYGLVRRAPDLVGLPIVAADRTPDLYAALGRWTAAVDDPANQLTLQLDVGDLVAFDNRRILHGRSAFQLGERGRRRLLGCYLDIDELLSRRTVLRAGESRGGL